MTETMKTRQTFKQWWNEVIITRKKHFIRGVILAILLLIGVQVQIGRQAAAAQASIARQAIGVAKLASYDAEYRTWLVAESQYESCVSKINSRLELRSVLAKIIDLSDVVTSDRAVQYTKDRQAYIDANYPEYPAGTCPSTPPEAPKRP